MDIAAGIDIGGTNVRIGLVDRGGDCLAVSRLCTGDFSSPSLFVKAVADELKKWKSQHHFVGTGIGAPNGNYYTGCIEHAPNLPWKGIVPLVELLEQESGLPCILTNDANAATMGEMWFGGAKNLSDFILITLGTGLGSGIVSNKQLVHGHDGLAAELGHVIVEKNGRDCGCGRKGCLETYVSASGLKRTMELWLQQGRTSALKGKGRPLRSVDIYEAACAGDALALEVFEFTGEMLGTALANSAAYTSPKAIFLLGGLARAGHLLFEPTIRHFECNLMPHYRNKISIQHSHLADDTAAILGAASLAWNSFSG